MKQFKDSDIVDMVQKVGFKKAVDCKVFGGSLVIPNLAASLTTMIFQAETLSVGFLY